MAGNIIPGIPLISQLGEGADLMRQDCGPACQDMLLYAYKGVFYNPDDFYEFMDIKKDVGTKATDLVKFAAMFDLEETEAKGLTLKELRGFVDQQRPPICLISYKPLSDAKLTQFTGSFNHWLVVVGYDDDNILVNDPYRTDGFSYRPIPNKVFQKAFYGTAVIALTGVTGEYAMTTTHRVNKTVSTLTVRSGPGTTYAAVGYLKTGEELVVSSITNNWAKVDGPRLWGYAYAAYLESLQVVTTIKPDVYDVSHWEAGVGSRFIDWDVVSLTGIMAVITKATQGTTYVNPTFGHDWGQLRYNMRVKRGTYHYFDNNMDPIAQAEHFINILQGDYGELIPALDCEDPAVGNDLANKIKAFLDHFKARTGIQMMIYTYPSFWKERIGVVGWATEYKLWIAHYGVSQPILPPPWTEAAMWQFSDSGTVSGIVGKVDFNKVYTLPTLPPTPPPGTNVLAIKKGTIDQVIGELVRMRDNLT